MDIKEEIKKVILDYLSARKERSGESKGKMSLSASEAQGILDDDPNYAYNPFDGMLSILSNEYGKLANQELVLECLIELIKEDKVTLFSIQALDLGGGQTLIPVIIE